MGPEQVEGFLTLPIKVMSEEKYKALTSEYERWEDMGLDPEENVNEDDYVETTNMYVRPESIVGFKPADDGHVDITTNSILDFTRVFIKYDEFLKMINE